MTIDKLIDKITKDRAFYKKMLILNSERAKDVGDSFTYSEVDRVILYKSNDLYHTLYNRCCVILNDLYEIKKN